MNIGQKVMLIANHGLINLPFSPPPIGAIGEIRLPIDQGGDYYVMFDEHPCPTDDEPEWYVAAWALIPIDEPPKLASFEIANDALLLLGASGLNSESI
jgi:hypothetical protein